MHVVERKVIRAAGIAAVEIGISSAFVAVVPGDDAGVVHVALHHFLNEPRAVGGINHKLVAVKLVENVKAEPVASVPLE